MVKPKSKAQLLDEIRTRHERLEEKISSLPRDVFLIPKTVGAWSVKDTIAHVTAWEKKLLTWYRDGLTGKKIEMPDWRVKGTLGAINRRIFEENLDRDLKDVLNDFAATYRRVLSTIESIPEEDIFTPGRFVWTGTRTLLRYIWANTAGHYNEHLGAINRMKK
jgi:hypothetical protein